MTFESALKALCQRPLWEAQWLNMLSQLEYMGYRKIIKGVAFDRVTVDVLHHISEEASHAFLMRRAVEQVFGPVAWSRSGLSEVGYSYFQSVDDAISRLDKPAYYAVSWVIEQRVLQVYPLYLACTQQVGVQRVLRRVLAQERRHAGQFEAELDGPFKARALELETDLWAQFVRHLHLWVSAQPNFD